MRRLTSSRARAHAGSTLACALLAWGATASLGLAGGCSSTDDAPSAAGSDGGVDGAMDARAIESGVDGAVDPNDPNAPIAGWTDGWERAAWAPECGVYVAPSAAVLARIAPLAFGPCASGRAGCVELLPTWTTRPGWSVPALSADGRHGVDGRALIARDYAAHQREWIAVDDLGRISAAWREDGGACARVGASLAGGEVALTEGLVSHGAVASFVQIVGDPARFAGRATADYAFSVGDLGGDDTLGTPLANSRVVAMPFVGSGTVAFRDRVSGALDLDHDSDLAGVSGGIAIAGAGAIYPSGQRLVAWGPGGARHVLVDGATTNVRPHSVATDGLRMAWLETPLRGADDAGAPATRSTLVTSLHTLDPASLIPTRGASIACVLADCRAQIANGYLTLLEPQGEGGARNDLLVVPLAGGATLRAAALVTATRSETFTDRVVVGDELWARFEGHADGATTRGLVRIALQSLPPVQAD